MKNANTTKKIPDYDWKRFDAMTDQQRHAAALADPDAQPVSPENIGRMKRTPQVKVIRRALGLSQEEFAARFHIPLGTLRDWEQSCKEPENPGLREWWGRQSRTHPTPDADPGRVGISLIMPTGKSPGGS
ncbi:MAG: hypothetical protein M0Z81_18680 [Deltaproteobacteria bacterium]|jgi:putative transcriptional regulator|nr:hypothetical protein [Deltaproteobacteria bacterium]